MKMNIFIGANIQHLLRKEAVCKFPGHDYLYYKLIKNALIEMQHNFIKTPEDKKSRVSLFSTASQVFIKKGNPLCLYGDQGLLEEYGDMLNNTFDVEFVKTTITTYDDRGEYILPDPTKEGDYSLNSFSVITTKEMKLEAAVLLSTIRYFHKQPIYVFCDTESKEFFEGLAIDDLRLRVELDPEQMEEARNRVKNIEQKTDFHRADVIFKKMEVMEWALEEVGSTLFLDADIVFARPIPESYNTEIVLSPHYHSGPTAREQTHSYGVFNAGYVFCANKTFPEHWRNIYLTRSRFFEQQGMDYIKEDYEVSVFDRSHNCGPWVHPTDRGNTLIRTFHCHLDIKEGEAKDYTGAVTQKIQRRMLSELRQGDYPEVEEIIKKYCDIDLVPKKLAFIHMYKCGGGFLVDIISNHSRFKDGAIYNSYSETIDLQRDWTREELRKIITTAEDNSFLHNHIDSWDEELLTLLVQNGWTTVMFTRELGDVLCSMWYYLKESPLHKCNVSLDTFIDLILTPPFTSMYKIPDWFRRVDFFYDLNEKSLKWFYEYFLDNPGLGVTNNKYINTTNNPGYNRCKDWISAETASKVVRGAASYNEYKKFITDWLGVRNKTCSA